VRQKAFTLVCDKFTQNNMYQILSQSVNCISNNILVFFSVHSVHMSDNKNIHASICAMRCIRPYIPGERLNSLNAFSFIIGRTFSYCYCYRNCDSRI